MRFTSVITLLAFTWAAGAAGPKATWSPLLRQNTDTEKAMAWPAAAVAADETSGDLYMVVPNEGIWKSADGGATFARADDGEITGRCESSQSINCDTAGKRLACLMLDGTCALSTDSGKTWHIAKNAGRSWAYAAVDWRSPEPKTIVAMSHEPAGELCLSTDAGQSWKPIARNPKINALGIVDDKTIVIGDGAGIQRSTDAGATWQKVSDLRPVGRVMRTRGDTAYWLAEGGIICSKDQGVTWEKRGAPVEATVGPFFGANERRIVVVGKRGFIESNDGGVTWHVAAPLPAAPGVAAADPAAFQSLAWGESIHNNFYAARADGGTYKYERGWPMRRRVVAFGDSNTHGWTESTVGWSDGLDRLVPGTQIIMAGQKGRRVGMGVTDIDRVLKSAGHVDEVIVSLGTDDAGPERMALAGGAAGLAAGMEQIILKIKAYHATPDDPAPAITIVAPPPFGSQLNQMNREKYGANPNASLEEVIPLYRDLALKHDVRYFDLYTPLKPDVDHLIWIDGLHYRARATIFPRLIATFLSDNTPPAPPADLKVKAGRLTWTPSPSTDVLGYEIVADGKVIATCVEPHIAAPAGVHAVAVRARDGIGLRSDEITLKF